MEEKLMIQNGNKVEQQMKGKNNYALRSSNELNVARVFFILSAVSRAAAL